MAKSTKKLIKTNSNTINSVLTNNKTSPKSRQQIYSENYQKNKERKRQQRRERYKNQNQPNSMRKEARLNVNVIGVRKVRKFKGKSKNNYSKRIKPKKNNVPNVKSE